MAERPALTSDDLNAAVFRYLQESGFEHTAFNFYNEAGLGKWGAGVGKGIPYGALVTVVQKGLQYMELEANCDNCDSEDFRLLKASDLMTKDVDELKKEIVGSVKIELDQGGAEERKENAEAHNKVVIKVKKQGRKEEKRSKK